MATRDLIVIGASAGGVEALSELVAALPADLAAAVCIVLHVPPDSPSALPAILQVRSRLPVAHAVNDEPVERGRIYVAPPDQHLVLEAGRLRLTRGPRENRSRPAIDVLFRSAAYGYAERTIGVVLTGALDDGTAGLWSIVDRGGTAIAQEPKTAQHDSMPLSAIRNVRVDHVLPLAQISPQLVLLTRSPSTKTAAPVSRELEIETKIASEGRGLQLGVMELGPVTPYTCPECHGVLVSLKEGGVPRFRCHTGHAYSINTLLAEVTGYVEATLWNSIRAIEESMMVLQHLGRHVGADPQADPQLVALIAEKARDAGRRADIVRQVVLTHQTLSEDNVVAVARKAR